MTKIDQQEPCRFCGIEKGQGTYGAADVPLLSDGQYFSITSIGALVEGWSLIIPRQHCLSMAAHYGNERLAAFLARMLTRVESVYGKAVMFEHGATHANSATSCGTSHAHIHLVPLSFSLLDAVGKVPGLKWEKSRSSEIKTRIGTSEYLFFTENPRVSDPVGHLHMLGSPQSQFFRKIIARELGQEHRSDYKTNAMLDTAELTHRRLADASLVRRLGEYDARSSSHG